MLSNIAAGSGYHKEIVMKIVTSGDEVCPSILIKFLEDNRNSHIRVVAVWCIINLTYPGDPNVKSHVLRLQEAGIQLQLLKMVDDPCLDVKVGIWLFLDSTGYWLLCIVCSTCNTEKNVLLLCNSRQSTWLFVLSLCALWYPIGQEGVKMALGHFAVASTIECSSVTEVPTLM